MQFRARLKNPGNAIGESGATPAGTARSALFTDSKRAKRFETERSEVPDVKSG
jgi:hypothetical protein